MYQWCADGKPISNRGVIYTANGSGAYFSNDYKIEFRMDLSAYTKHIEPEKPKEVKLYAYETIGGYVLFNLFNKVEEYRRKPEADIIIQGGEVKK